MKSTSLKLSTTQFNGSEQGMQAVKTRKQPCDALTGALSPNCNSKCCCGVEGAFIIFSEDNL